MIVLPWSGGGGEGKEKQTAGATTEKANLGVTAKSEGHVQCRVNLAKTPS